MEPRKIQNPDGNTGLNLQISISADYLNITTVLPDEETVRDCFGEIAYRMQEDGGLIWSADKGIWKGRYYAHTANTVHGIKMAWHPRIDKGFDVWVSIPGGSLSRVDGRLHLSFFKMLKRRYGFQPTRLDIALDDYEKRLSKEIVIEALEQGNYVGFSKYSVHVNSGKKKNKDKGWTIYLGSRQSDKMYRLYDKSAESNGKIDAYRLECELKDFKAKQLWELMMQLPDSNDNARMEMYQSLLLEVLVGGVDFRDLSVDSNMSRCPKLQWWADFLDYVHSSGGLKLGAARSESSLQKTLTWVKRQVETSLAMLRDVLGSQQFHLFIRDAIDSGRLRYGRQHEAILQLHRYGYDTVEMMIE